MKIIFYKNSIITSIISIFGCIFIICGVVVSVSGGFLYGIPMALIGWGMMAAARKISENKALKQLIKNFKENGIEDIMRQSTDICLEVYKENRFDKKVTDYIISVNPQATSVINAYEATFNNNTN